MRCVSFCLFFRTETLNSLLLGFRTGFIYGPNLIGVLRLELLHVANHFSSSKSTMSVGIVESVGLVLDGCVFRPVWIQAMSSDRFRDTYGQTSVLFLDQLLKVTVEPGQCFASPDSSRIHSGLFCDF